MISSTWHGFLPKGKYSRANRVDLGSDSESVDRTSQTRFRDNCCSGRLNLVDDFIEDIEKLAVAYAEEPKQSAPVLKTGTHQQPTSTGSM